MMTMKCAACGMPTIMTYRLNGVEAAFCPRHMPVQKETRRIKIVVSMATNYF